MTPTEAPQEPEDRPKTSAFRTKLGHYLSLTERALGYGPGRRRKALIGFIVAAVLTAGAAIWFWWVNRG